MVMVMVCKCIPLEKNSFSLVWWAWQYTTPTRMPSECGAGSSKACLIVVQSVISRLRDMQKKRAGSTMMSFCSEEVLGRTKMLVTAMSGLTTLRISCRPGLRQNGDGNKNTQPIEPRAGRERTQGRARVSTAAVRAAACPP